MWDFKLHNSLPPSSRARTRTQSHFHLGNAEMNKTWFLYWDYILKRKIKWKQSNTRRGLLSATMIQSDTERRVRNDPRGQLWNETADSKLGSLGTQALLQYMSAHLNRAPDSSPGSATDYMPLAKMMPNQDFISLEDKEEMTQSLRPSRALSVMASVNDCQLQ